MLAKAKWQVDTIKVLEMLFEHRSEQVAQYGHNDDLLDYAEDGNPWLARTSHALHAFDAEQIEEAFRAEYEQYQAHAANGLPTWMHLVREEFAEWAEAMAVSPVSDEAVTEAIQTAALLVSWVECVLRRRAALADLL